MSNQPGKPFDKDLIQYVGPFGYSSNTHNFWDDFEDVLKEKILQYKIIKIKIYYSSDEENKEQEKYLIGISLTYQNLFTGEKKELEHKGTDKITGTREFNIDSGDYLKKFHINFNDDFDHISQIGFTTFRNREIFVGIKDGLDKTIKQNDEDYILLGTYGYFEQRMDGIGCLFADKKLFLNTHLFGYFMMKYLIKHNETFKKEWDDNYKKLSIDFQFLWRAVTLPDAIFSCIIKFCSF